MPSRPMHNDDETVVDCRRAAPQGKARERRQPYLRLKTGPITEYDGGKEGLAFTLRPSVPPSLRPSVPPSLCLSVAPTLSYFTTPVSFASSSSSSLASIAGL